MPHPEFTTSVAVRHLPEQSDPKAGQFAFAYTITIRNSGDITAQLIARHAVERAAWRAVIGLLPQPLYVTDVLNPPRAGPDAAPDDPLTPIELCEQLLGAYVIAQL